MKAIIAQFRNNCYMFLIPPLLPLKSPQSKLSHCCFSMLFILLPLQRSSSTLKTIAKDFSLLKVSTIRSRIYPVLSLPIPQEVAQVLFHPHLIRHPPPFLSLLSFPFLACIFLIRLFFPQEQQYLRT